jgi:branched-chain amino acid transport system permease protein
VIMAMMVFRPQGLLPSRRRSREITLSEEGVGHADALGSGVGA